jgi:hypothetical protein
LIIGAMKSGTTSLRAYLDAHPQAFCAREIHFFNKFFDRGPDWYRAQFADAGGVPAVGEKCPEYLYYADVLERIASALPDAKMIVILRNPIDRAYSHYWHERRGGRERLSFPEAIAAEPERMRADPRTPFSYVERGRYLPQLEHLFALYPRERVLVLLFEDLEQKPAETFSRACRFLGIDDSVRPDVVGRRTNTYRVHRPEWLWHMMFRRRLWRWLGPGARIAARLMEREAEYPKIDDESRADLAARFALDNAALARFLEIDLSRWEM